MTTTLLLALTLTAPIADAGQAQAPPAAASQLDARFATWIGCWRLEDDLAGNGVRTCITPEGAGVRLQTIVGTQRGLDELVIPDGVTRPIADSECKGTERSEWSKDGLRVFRTTDVTCANETARAVTSVTFLAAGPSWVNVQHVTGKLSRTTVRVQRYRRAFNQTLADGSKAPQPAAVGAPASEVAWSVDDVIEASAKLPAEALEAALSEVRHGFNVNKQTLVALDDANVPESVIDLMIALTFPKRFAIDRRGGGGGGDSAIGISTGTGWFDPFMYPSVYGPYADCYGYGYRSYYGMCGSYYGYYGGYYGGYYPGYPPGGWIIVDPGPIGPAQPVTEGRVVNGRGYTQVRPRGPEPAPVRVSGNGGNGTASGWSGGSSGSSGVSSQGYSSGSSGGSSGSSSGGDSGARTAVPRPPGGGI